jgi:hypothetical protein
MTTNPLSEAREAVAAALAGLGVRVYPQPVENPSPPCLQVYAAGDWLQRRRVNGGQVDVRLTVRISVPSTSGNSEALVALEDLTWKVLAAIPVVEVTQAPASDTAGQTDVYAVDVVTIVTASD